MSADVMFGSRRKPIGVMTVEVQSHSGSRRCVVKPLPCSVNFHIAYKPITESKGEIIPLAASAGPDRSLVILVRRMCYDPHLLGTYSRTKCWIWILVLGGYATSE